MAMTTLVAIWAMICSLAIRALTEFSRAASPPIRGVGIGAAVLAAVLILFSKICKVLEKNLSFSCKIVSMGWIHKLEFGKQMPNHFKWYAGTPRNQGFISQNV